MKTAHCLWAALTLFAVTAVGAQSLPQRTYIVQLKEPPAATYTGGVAGLPATKPPAGQRLNVSASDVQAYLGYVATKQNTVLAAMPSVQVLHRYDTVFNGFAAVLTEDQARQMKARSDVQSVQISEWRQLSTSYTPKFLGLDKPGGLWPQLGGPAGAGEDVIIGVIDTGVAPDNPAFADSVDANGVPSFTGTKVYGPPPARWKGTCETGPGFKASDCNNKLIGARIFNKEWKQYIDVDAKGFLFWGDTEFVSARDSEGHGSHTASTAAGNHGVPASVGGIDFGKTSGMAPRARLAIYKACWVLSEPASGLFNVSACRDSALVAAIDQAVKDGVQVISISVSGAPDALTPSDIAALGAVNAGVFVAEAGGNEGPAPSTVNHGAPWITTVAASSHDRTFEAVAQLGNGSRYPGASINLVPVSPAPLIDSSLAALAGSPPGDATLCAKGSLDPAKVQGKIVVCDRGVVALTEKSATVKDAGGVGMLLLNVPNGLTDTVAVAHSVPTVHLGLDSRSAIKAYVAQAGATASIGVYAATYGKVPAPVVTDFSSRGPNKFDPGIMKPDVAAPGAQILASVAAVLTPAQYAAVSAGTATAPPTFDFYQGTSMATPHVAGVAALLIQKHPDWSPSAVRSALMTTAFATKPDGLGDALGAGIHPWAQGAGQIDPTSAADPGLVYRVPAGDYERYLCGTTDLQTNCTGVTPMKAADLNQPAITLPAVVGAASVTRSVTNVSTSPAVYTASASVPGYNVVVTPSGLSLAPGETKSFTVSIKATGANSGWAYGSLTWTDGQHVVRSPLSAFASALAAPDYLPSEATTGSKVFTVGTGVPGQLKVVPNLKASTLTTGHLNGIYEGGTCITGVTDPDHFVTRVVNVPAGALALRVAIYPEDYPASVSLRLNANNTYLGFPDGSGTSTINIRNPVAGPWYLCAFAYGLPPGGADVKLHSWVVMPGDLAGNLKAMAPSSASVGGTATIGLSWQNLLTSERYFGALDYQYNGASIGSTLLEITPGGSFNGIHGGVSAPSSSAMQPKARSSFGTKKKL